MSDLQSQIAAMLGNSQEFFRMSAHETAKEAQRFIEWYEEPEQITSSWDAHRYHQALVIRDLPKLARALLRVLEKANNHKSEEAGYCDGCHNLAGSIQAIIAEELSK